MITEVGQALKHLSLRRRSHLLLLLGLNILVSIAELISIAAVAPFLAVMLSPDYVSEINIARPLINFFALQSPTDMRVFLTGLFVATVLMAGSLRVTLLWLQTRLSRAIGADLSTIAYERVLSQPYQYHMKKNSSEVLVLVRKAEGLVIGLIQPFMFLVSSAIILVPIFTAFLVIYPLSFNGVILLVVLFYVVVASLTRKHIKKNSQNIAIEQVRVTRAIQEGLGGIRHALIDRSQPYFLSLYKDALRPLQESLARNQFIGASPRFALEALSMALIAVVALFLVIDGDQAKHVTDAITSLGVLAVGIQRTLPALQQIYSSHITIKGNLAATRNALEILNYQGVNSDCPPRLSGLKFEARVSLRNVGFRYSDSAPWVIRNLTLEIPKGCRMGIKGPSGSGKSTLVDIMMGLLAPNEGELIVDDTVICDATMYEWQSKIAHVSQSIYLSDSSIAENIAFGVPSKLIDYERVRLAAERAQIYQAIACLPDAFNTTVGERGIRLSGGQRQRIGLARAFYKNAEFIVLDEATGALDYQTEDAVLTAIDSISDDTTIIQISHRTTTLNGCHMIFDLSEHKTED